MRRFGTLFAFLPITTMISQGEDVQMNAIIIGAGMGGMSAALALEQAGITTQVFEAVKVIRPVGAAISLWPNGIKCLNLLGLHDAIQRLGGTMQHMAYRDAVDGHDMTCFSLAPLVKAVGEHPYPIARAELQDLLIDTYGRDRTCPNASRALFRY